MQNTTTLPINDSPAFVAIMKLLTASNPAAGLWSLSFKDKLRVFRTLALVQVQSHQTIKPYQQLRYGSNVPFRHGPDRRREVFGYTVLGQSGEALAKE